MPFRIGLLPLRADPRLFEYPTSSSNNEDEVSDQDTLRYEIKVTCSYNTNAPKDSKCPDDIYRNNNGKFNHFIYYLFNNKDRGRD